MKSVIAASLSRRNWFECHRHAVHAVAQARRLRSVIEQMPEMTAAAAAMDRRAGHAVGLVLFGTDGFLQRRPEARPAGAALELRGRRKQIEIAARAGKVA